MGPLEITGTARLVLGLVTGILFGFILKKAKSRSIRKSYLSFAGAISPCKKSCSRGFSRVWSVSTRCMSTWLGQSSYQADLAGREYPGGLIFGVGMLLLGF